MSLRHVAVVASVAVFAALIAGHGLHTQTKLF